MHLASEPSFSYCSSYVPRCFSDLACRLRAALMHLLCRDLSPAAESPDLRKNIIDLASDMKQADYNVLSLLYIFIEFFLVLGNIE